MKQGLTILAMSVALSSSMKAQLDFSKGVLGGFNVAVFDGSNASTSYSSTTQYAFGAFADVKLSDRLSIEPEVLYSVKGAIVTIWNGPIPKGSEDFPITQTLGYLDIPVLLKYYLPLPAPEISIYAAPRISFLLNANIAMKAFGTTYEQDFMDRVANTDDGFLLGAGLSIPTGFVVLRMDVRYDFGLTNLSKSDVFKYHNRVAEVLIGVSF